MFMKVMAAALALGATGGATIAVAENLATTASPPPRHQPVEGAPCAPTTFRIYFEPGAAQLNGDARRTIDSAAKAVAGCPGVEFDMAADAGQIGEAESLRLVAQRSVAVLAALRTEGVSGDVYVAPLGGTVVAAERNAGPDFVQVAMNPVDPPQLVAGNAR